MSTSPPTFRLTLHYPVRLVTAQPWNWPPLIASWGLYGWLWLVPRPRRQGKRRRRRKQTCTLLDVPLERLGERNRWYFRPGETIAEWEARTRWKRDRVPTTDIPGVRWTHNNSLCHARAWVFTTDGPMDINLGLFDPADYGGRDGALEAASRAYQAFDAAMTYLKEIKAAEVAKPTYEEVWGEIQELQQQRAWEGRPLRFGRTVVPTSVLPRWVFEYQPATRTYYAERRIPHKPSVRLPGPYPDAWSACEAMLEVFRRENAGSPAVILPFPEADQPEDAEPVVGLG